MSLETVEPVVREDVAVGLTSEQMNERLAAQSQATTPAAETAAVETPTVETQPTTEATVDTAPDVISLLKNQGLEFESLDDIKAAFEAKRNPVKNEFDEAPDDVKEYLNWRKAGGNPEDFYKEKGTDYSKMNDIEVLKLSLKKQNPNYSDTLINDIVTEKYQLDQEFEEGDDIPRNIRIAREMAAADAVAAREELNKTRIDFSKPFIPKEVAEMQKIKEQNEKQLNEFKSKVASISLENLNEKVELTDEKGEKFSVDFKYSVPTDLQTALKDYIVNPSKLAEKFSNGSELDMAKLGEALAWSDPRIRQAFANDAAKIAVENFMKSIKNTQPHNPQPTAYAVKGEDVDANRQAYAKSRGIK
jgi:hypothetical protein